MDKPTFNVVIPFEGVTVIQLNRSMSDLVSGFILDFEDVEVEMYALAEFLRDPGSWSRRETSTAFSVDLFADVVNLQVNQHMADLIKSFIDEADGDVEVEIRALSKALGDPYKCYELRRERAQKRRPRDDYQSFDKEPAYL